MSEMLFYGGIGVMVTAAVGGLVAVITFATTGKNLRKRLDLEYGKKRR